MADERDVSDDVGTTRNDAACIIPWRASGYEAIEIFVDPLIDDRVDDICQLATAWSGEVRTLDALNDAIMTYADAEGLSASVFERPAGELSKGVVAVAITVG